MTRERHESLNCVTVGGKSLEVLLCQPAFAQETIVLLHEALGSVSYWKDFPDKLSAATGCTVLAYSRAGHGNSQGPLEPRNQKYYQNQVEAVLPALLDHFHVESPVLYGHSEGAVIALLYAAQEPQKVRALIAEAPVLTPEPRSRNRIRELAATYPVSELKNKLVRYHNDSEAVFHSWIAGVTSPQMVQFPLDMYLPKIICPVLLLQGSEDEFGGSTQLHAIQKYLPHAQCEVLTGAGHLPHRDKTDVVIEKVRIFLSSLSPAVQQCPVVSHPPLVIPE